MVNIGGRNVMVPEDASFIRSRIPKNALKTARAMTKKYRKFSDETGVDMYNKGIKDPMLYYRTGQDSVPFDGNLGWRNRDQYGNPANMNLPADWQYGEPEGQPWADPASYMEHDPYLKYVNYPGGVEQARNTQIFREALDQYNQGIISKEQLNQIRGQLEGIPQQITTQRYGGDPFSKTKKRSLRKKQGGQIGNVDTATLQKLIKAGLKFDTL